MEEEKSLWKGILKRVFLQIGIPLLLVFPIVVFLDPGGYHQNVEGELVKITTVKRKDVSQSFNLFAEPGDLVRERIERDTFYELTILIHREVIYCDVGADVVSDLNRTSHVLVSFEEMDDGSKLCLDVVADI